MANNTPISTKQKMEHKENTTTWTEMQVLSWDRNKNVAGTIILTLENSNTYINK